MCVCVLGDALVRESERVVSAVERDCRDFCEIYVCDTNRLSWQKTTTTQNTYEIFILSHRRDSQFGLR